jgi:hypothetical protein
LKGIKNYAKGFSFARKQALKYIMLLIDFTWQCLAVEFLSAMVSRGVAGPVAGWVSGEMADKHTDGDVTNLYTIVSP